MSIESRFLHTLTVQHGVSGTEDAWGHAAVTFPDYAWVTVRGLVQERTGREINGPKLGGTVIADAVIFLPIGTEVAESDRIVHGAKTYEVLYVKDAAGVGHHLEVNARSIRSGLDVSP